MRGSEEEVRRWWKGREILDLVRSKRLGVVLDLWKSRIAGREATRMMREGSMGAVRRVRMEAEVRFVVVMVEVAMADVMEAAAALWWCQPPVRCVWEEAGSGLLT